MDGAGPRKGPVGTYAQRNILVFRNRKFINLAATWQQPCRNGTDAGRAGAPAEPMPADQVGVVFPVYAFGIPVIIEDFIRALAVPAGAYVFSVATMARIAGAPHREIDGILRRTGPPLGGLVGCHARQLSCCRAAADRRRSEENVRRCPGARARIARPSSAGSA